MLPEVKRFLSDACDSAKCIVEFTADHQITDLTDDTMLRSAVYWQFAIIGEALSQLRKLDDVTFNRITESWRIVGFRNQILHGYQKIQDTVAWQIIQDKVPILIAELDQLLKE